MLIKPRTQQEKGASRTRSAKVSAADNYDAATYTVCHGEFLSIAVLSVVFATVSLLLKWQVVDYGHIDVDEKRNASGPKFNIQSIALSL